MSLNTPLTKVVGIGPSIGYKLKKLNLNTLEDLIAHYPFRYDDFSNVSNVLEAKIGEKVTLTGEVWSIKNVFTRSRKVLTQAVFNDGTSPIELTWFNQSWLTKQIAPGDKLQVSGKVSKYKNRLSIIAPVWEKITDTPTRQSTETLHTGRLVPVYPETMGLTSKWLRTKIDQILPAAKKLIEDPLPEEIKGGMLDLPEAVEKIHFPKNYDDVNKARERLSFDELFYIQLATQKVRNEWKNKPLIDPLTVQEPDLDQIMHTIPFELTKAQNRVILEIIEDLKKHQPMNRLIQGEVGSGKTVVAAIIAYLVFKNRLKTLFMAPTEILAFQHYTTLHKLLEPLGVNVGIYTGSKKQVKNSDIIVGTHALLSDKLLTEDVGLIIVDEQQRFGVQQRSLLRSKAKVPHFLTMTATPIPRTIALTIYGDLDISIIDELPKGRQKVQTHVVPNKKRLDAYKFIAKKVKEEGDQVYIITPLIELSETLESAKAATAEFFKLQKVWPDLKLGLLHGRLKPKEKEEVINKFKNHELEVLVSTSVIEVGVDVSNATIMLIESAERFGLAQLHQLRGRVGRGAKKSFCFLFTEEEQKANLQRLKSLETIHDGLKLAELDLKIRGAGEIFGVKQSGRFELKIASFADLPMIEKTREAAKKLLQKDQQLAKYPSLKLKLQTIAANAMPD